MIIYVAKNKVNGMVYVGKTVQSFKRRKQNHLAHARRGSTFYFHRAIRKYGEDAFEWKTVLTADNNDDLCLAEKDIIAKLKKETKIYNMTEGGEGVCGRVKSEDERRRLSIANKGQIPWIKGKTHSAETLKKISIANSNPSDATREKMRKASIGRNVGRVQSEEEKSKRSISCTGRKLTDEDNRKISESKIGKPLSVEHKTKISSSAKKQFSSIESRENHAAIMRKYYADKKEASCG